MPGRPRGASVSLDMSLLAVLPAAFSGPPPPVPPATINRDATGRATLRAIRITTPLRIDGRRSAFRTPNVCDVALAPHVNPVSGAVQDVRLNLPKGFIFRSAQAARTLVMRLFGTGALSFDHSGKNAFFARLEFQGP